MNKILIVEDEGIIRSALKRLLERNGYAVAEAGSVGAARELLSQQEFNLIISDLRLPGEEGTQLLDQSTPVLIMTSYASLRSAIDAMKQGAVDYIAKPFDHDEMLKAVNELISQQLKQPAALESTSNSNLGAENTQAANSNVATQETENTNRLEGMLGASPAMQKVFAQIKKIAPFDTRVLILGESGTGKELVAKALHNLSPRRTNPLISVNCAAIPETLIESELFGHEKGAFTGANTSRNGLIEAANGGTLFLDEIGELPLDAQARLLRVLQEGEIRRLGSVEARRVDVRLVAATHRDISSLVDAGKFRLDLYYRLNVIELELPCLAEREDDLLLIADQLLESICQRLGKPKVRLSKAARDALLSYTWPGNVRELENRVERAVILSEDTLLQAEDLELPFSFNAVPKADFSSRSQAKDAKTSFGSATKAATKAATNRKTTSGAPISSTSSAAPTTLDKQPEDLSLEDYFVRFVQENEEQMSETQLAKRLGISRKSLWERRQRLGIPRRKTGNTNKV